MKWVSLEFVKCIKLKNVRICIKNLPTNINYPHPLEEQLITAEVSSEQVVVGEESPLPQQSQFPPPHQAAGQQSRRHPG